MSLRLTLALACLGLPTLLSAGAPDSAADLAAAERRAQLQAEDPDVQFNLGVLARQAGQLDKAEAALEKASRLAPQDPEVQQLYGELLQEQGKWAESLAPLERCLAKDPGRVEALLSLGLSYSRLDKLEQAAAAFEKAASKAPQDAEIQADLGLVRLRQRKTAAALKAFERAATPGGGSAVVRANLCQLYNQLGRYSEAAAACRSALAKPTASSANTHYNLGYALVKLGEEAEATQSFQRAIQLDPALAPAHYSLGLGLYEQGLLEASAKAFRDALQARSGAYPEARYNLAVALGDLGRWQEAAGEFRGVLERSPGDDDARANLDYVVRRGTQEHLGQGTAAYMAGDVAAAITAWKAALALDPSHAKAKEFLAKAQEQSQAASQDQAAQAAQASASEAQAGEDKKVLAKALAALEKGAAKEALRGLAYYVKNHPADTAARRSLTQARSQLMRQASDLLDAAAVSKEAGDAAAAASALAKALDLDPGNARARQLSRELSVKAAKPEAEDLQALYFQGVQAYLKGDLALAQKTWRAVLARDPAHLDAGNNLRRVEAERAALAKFKKG